MKISIIAFLPVIVGIIAGLLGGLIYKKNNSRKNNY